MYIIAAAYYQSKCMVLNTGGWQKGLILYISEEQKVIKKRSINQSNFINCCYSCLWQFIIVRSKYISNQYNTVFLFLNNYIKNIKQLWYFIFPNKVVILNTCFNNCFWLKAKVDKVQVHVFDVVFLPKYFNFNEHLKKS